MLVIFPWGFKKYSDSKNTDLLGMFQMLFQMLFECVRICKENKDRNNVTECDTSSVRQLTIQIFISAANTSYRIGIQVPTSSLPAAG